MPRSPKRFFPLLLAVIAALFCAAVLVGRPRTLLAKATAVRTGVDRFPQGAVSFWLPDGRVLVLSDSTRRYPTFDLAPAVYDPATGQKTVLSALGHALHSAEYLSLQQSRLSPDGKWLVTGVHGQPQTCTLASLDGAHAVEVPVKYADTNYAHTVWAPDSRSWLYVAEDPYDHCAHVRIYDTGGKLLRDVAHAMQFYGREPLGFVIGERVVAASRTIYGDGGIPFAEFGLYPNCPPRRLYDLTAPGDASAVMDVALSPRGDRLAWAFAYTPVPLGIRALRRSRLFRGREPSSFGLCVSRVDGSAMRDLGRLSSPGDRGLPYWAAPGRLRCLRWTPDGKRVSFLYEDGLYTVPAD